MSFWYDANKKEYASDGKNGWMKAFCVKMCNEVKTDALNLANELRGLLQSHFSGEKNRHMADDVDYSKDITVKEKLDALQNNINSEEASRTVADSALQSTIGTEITNRQNADTVIAGRVTQEITDRQSADNILRTSINNETTARQNADNALKSDLGNKNSLSTEDKSSLVNAVNEIVEKLLEFDKIGTIDITEEECSIEDSVGIDDIYPDDYPGIEIYKILYAPSNLDGGTDNKIALFVTTTGYYDGSTAYIQYYIDAFMNKKYRIGRHLRNGIPTWEEWEDDFAYSSLKSHIASKNNPHSVTKTQVGLGNVPNVSTNDQAPTFTEASARANIASGEKLSIIMGKIKKFFTDLKAVAFSGSYNDLADKPALKTIATSGSYDDLTNKPTSMPPTSHASTGTTYGIGTASNYGHVKTSDSVTSTSDTSSGIAATPKAVKTAYDKALEVNGKRIWNSSGVTGSGMDSMAFAAKNVNVNGDRSVALAYGNSYDAVTDLEGATSLLAACAGSGLNGSTSAIIGGYAHNLDGVRALILGGYNNIAHGYNAVVGKSNKEPTASDYNSNGGDLFVVGNGTGSTRSNAFRVAANGNCYAGVAFNGTGADYNEVREWSDGNTDVEDRCGYMVAFEGTKIRLAQPGDNLRKVGIISGNSCITGNNFADYWHGKYKRDIYGRYETSPVHNDAEYDEDGNIVKEAYDGYAYVLSEDYDSALEDSYEPRLDRSEYDLMATHGEVVVRDDGTCEVDGYCIPSQDGIATKDNDEIGFYVMERVDGNHVRVFVR